MEIFGILLTILMLLALGFDLAKYIIPNWLAGMVLVLYPVFVLLSPAEIDWSMALLAGGVVFAVGYVLFALNWMGGGDVKLLTASAFWVGWSMLLVEYILMVAIVGGLASLVLLLIRPVFPYIWAEAQLPRLFRKGEPVPYGVGIAIGFLIMLWAGDMPGLPLLELRL